MKSHKTFHDAVAFVLEAQPPMDEEHELQRRPERVKRRQKQKHPSSRIERGKNGNPDPNRTWNSEIPKMENEPSAEC